MNLVDYEIADLTETDLDYIYRNLDALMKEVLTSFGWNDANFKLYLNLPHKWVARHKGVPFFAFGFVETFSCLCLWFIGTTELKRHVRIVHETVPTYLNTLRQNYPDMRIIVEISERKSNIFNWLQHLGFEFTQHVVGEKGKRRLIMEYK